MKNTLEEMNSRITEAEDWINELDVCGFCIALGCLSVNGKGSVPVWLKVLNDASDTGAWWPLHGSWS